MKRSLLILCLLWPLGASAQEFRLDVRDSAVAARYARQVHAIEQGNIEAEGSILIADDSRRALGFGAHLVDNAYTTESPVYVGLGGRLLWVDGGVRSGTVLALGAHGRMALPGFERASLSGHLYFAPDIISFGRATAFYEIAARGEYQVFENAWVYAGYRRSEADFAGLPSHPLDNGAHIGMRFTF